MGLFSKIKNFVTGGAAEVTITFDQPIVDGVSPINATVTAVAKAECKIKKVYFEIKGEETYVEQVTDTTSDDDSPRTNTRDERRNEIHHRKELTLAENVILNNGEEKSWEATFELPQNAPATYHGEEVFFKWEVDAGLDMPGIDPSSGWVEIIVAKEMNYTLDQVQ